MLRIVKETLGMSPLGIFCTVRLSEQARRNHKLQTSFRLTRAIRTTDGIPEQKLKPTLKYTSND